MAKKDSRTKAFATTAAKKGRNNPKNNKKLRHNIVIFIFVVVALILVVFASLIIAQIIGKSNTPSPSPAPNDDVEYILRDAGNIKMGNLLLINDEFKYTLPQDLSNMVNVKYQYLPNDADKQIIKIGNTYTYALTYDSICLTRETLDMFSQMVFDYCNNTDSNSTNKNSVSNLEVAWGGYSESTRNEYDEDITKYGKDYYDHALGTTVTLKINTPSTVITESILKEQFSWIYENAYKYGFIVRVPEECKDHTSFDSSKRVHLRYVGIEHATYIAQNKICFEEYLEQIRMNYSFSNPLVINAANGKTYSVYYVEYSGNPTSIQVPKNSNYEISGDNMNGFIVTVEK